MRIPALTAGAAMLPLAYTTGIEASTSSIEAAEMLPAEALFQPGFNHPFFARSIHDGDNGSPNMDAVFTPENLMPSSTKWNFGNVPSYKRVADNLLLIGVTHQYFGKVGPTKKIQRLKAELKKLDCLAFEGCEYVREHGNAMGRSYEGVAHAAFKGRMVFLDEEMGMINMSAAAKHGISPELFFVLQALPAVDGLTKRGLSAQEIQEKLPGIVTELSELYPELRNVATEEWPMMPFMSLLHAIKDRGEGGYHAIFDLCDLFTVYMGVVRDIEIHYPALVRLAEGKERIGCVIGAEHTEHIAQLFEGRLPKLPPWPEFAAGASEGIRYALEIVERAIEDSGAKASEEAPSDPVKTE